MSSHRVTEPARDDGAKTEEEGTGMPVADADERRTCNSGSSCVRSTTSDTTTVSVTTTTTATTTSSSNSSSSASVTCVGPQQQQEQHQAALAPAARKAEVSAKGGVTEAKKKNSKTKKKLIPNADAYHRMNFLYQAADLLMFIDPALSPLSHTYSWNLKQIAKKKVLRMDTSMGRSLCKKCGMLLRPGISSTVRIKARRERHVVVTCKECRTFKRYLCRDKTASFYSREEEAPMAHSDTSRKKE